MIARLLKITYFYFVLLSFAPGIMSSAFFKSVFAGKNIFSNWTYPQFFKPTVCNV